MNDDPEENDMQGSMQLLHTVIQEIGNLAEACTSMVDKLRKQINTISDADALEPLFCSVCGHDLGEGSGHTKWCSNKGEAVTYCAMCGDQDAVAPPTGVHYCVNPQCTERWVQLPFCPYCGELAEFNFKGIYCANCRCS